MPGPTRMPSLRVLNPFSKKRRASKEAANGVVSIEGTPRTSHDEQNGTPPDQPARLQKENEDLRRRCSELEARLGVNTGGEKELVPLTNASLSELNLTPGVQSDVKESDSSKTLEAVKAADSEKPDEHEQQQDMGIPPNAKTALEGEVPTEKETPSSIELPADRERSANNDETENHEVSAVPTAVDASEADHLRGEFAALKSVSAPRERDGEWLSESVSASQPDVDAKLGEHEAQSEAFTATVADTVELRAAGDACQCVEHLREMARLKDEHAALEARLEDVQKGSVIREQAILGHAREVERMREESSAFLATCDGLKREIEQMREVRAALESQLEAERAEKEEHSTARGVLNEEAERLRDEVSRLRDENAAHNEAVRRLEGEFTGLRGDVEAARAANNELERSFADRLRDETATLQGQLQSEQQETESMRQGLQSQTVTVTMLQGEVETLRQHLESEKQEKERLEKAHGVTGGELSVLKLQVAALQARLDAETVAAEYVRQQNEEQRQEILRLREECDEAQHTCDHFALSVANAHENTGRLQAEMLAERRSKEELQRAFDVEAGLVTQMRKKFDDMQRRVEDERRQREKLSLAQGGAKKELERLRQDVAMLQGQLEAEKKAVHDLAKAHEGETKEVSRLRQESAKNRKAHENKVKELESARSELQSLKQGVESQTKDMQQLQRVHDETARDASRMQGEVQALQQRVAEGERSRQHLRQEHEANTKEVTNLRTELTKVHAELAAEQSARLPLRRAYEDRIREVSRLRDEVISLQGKADAKKRKNGGSRSPTGGSKDPDRLRQDFKELKERFDNEQEERSRVQKAYEDRKEEVRRLRRETAALMKQTDNSSGEEIYAAVTDLNDKINYLANAVSDRWDIAYTNNGAHPAMLSDKLKRHQKSAIAILEPALGREFLQFLIRRTAGVRDDRDATLVLFALQACAIHALVDVFSDFCAGFNDVENGALRRIYEQMCQCESQTMASRWRALAHSYARASVPNFTESVNSNILESLVAKFTAVHLIVGGTTDVDSVPRDEFAIELDAFSKASMRLSYMIKELASARYEVYVAKPDQEFEQAYMEDALEGKSSRQKMGPMFCGIGMGLVEITHPHRGRDGEPGHPRVAHKAKVVCPDSVGRFLGGL